jgi:hypothetical protein
MSKPKKIPKDISSDTDSDSKPVKIVRIEKGKKILKYNESELSDDSDTVSDNLTDNNSTIDTESGVDSSTDLESDNKIKPIKIDKAKLKRQEKQTCRGLAIDGSKCKYEVEENKNCCSRQHSDMEDYTDDMFANLQLCKKCGSRRWRYFGETDRCANCQEKQHNEIDTICLGLQGDGKRCTNKKAPKKNYCAISHSYMDDYTDEMKANTVLCKGCKKYRYIGHFEGNKTCNICRERKKKINEKKQVIIKPKCQNIKCNNNASENKNFCDIHKMDQYKLDAQTLGMNLCTNYNRDCKQKLLPLNYEFAQCEGCRMRGREKEKKLKIDRKEKNICVYCGADNHTEADFIDEKGNITKQCLAHRLQCREHDSKARENGTKKTYPMSEETKAKKLEWRKKNQDKIIKYWSQYRGRQIAKLGEEYWKNNAKRAQEKRNQMTKEQRYMYNEGKKKNNNHKLQYYKYRAKSKNIKWTITDECAFELFNSNCTYCGCEPDEYYNGIDRIDNEQGYEENNVTSACRMCNMLKACLDYDIFIKRCEHILTNLGIIDGKKYANIFPKSTSGIYSTYKTSAKAKNLEFNLSENEFNKLVSDSCYLCGTESFNHHINGIDRFDSLKGYDSNNCRTCCTQCNYMKNNYSYDKFIEKIKQIYENNRDIILSFTDNPKNTIEFFSNEIYLYQRCVSLNQIIRTDIYIPKLILGKWKYNIDLSSDDFLILQSQELFDQNNLKEEIICLDNKFHDLKYLFLSQSHNKILNMELNNPLDIIKFTYDSNIGIQILGNHKKINIKLYYFNNMIVKISFNIDNKLLGYCKCDICIDHNKINKCLCDSCFSHLIHGHNNDCYWCSEYYTGNQYKSHTLEFNGDLKYISSPKLIKHTRKIIVFKKNPCIYSRGNPKDTIKLKKEKKIQKTAEEKKEEARLRKQKSRENMKNKYGNDKWHSIHAKEIQLQRLKNNTEGENNEKIEQIQQEINQLKTI